VKISDAIYELQERNGKLLASQKLFLGAPEAQSIIAGGFASGKTRIACTKGLILSAIFPGNRGMISRYHATDLEDSTMPSFFEVCPPSWIRSFNKQAKRLVLRNGSEIIFRHLHDPKAATRSRRVGADLGWAMIDQVEECELAHWNTMLSRVRKATVPKHFLFATMNPAGHDDYYKLFFEGIEEDLANLPVGRFYAIRRRGSRFGIAVRSEENRISNGGFVADAYFDELLRSYDRPWLNRYVYCSFEDFAGQIYREFNLSSVHNVRPFTIPAHWPTIVPIDVGGDVPWGIPIGRIDDFGNVVWTHEFYLPSVNSREVANWIKSNCAWADSNTTFIIDPENKLAMLELSDYGIHCQPAAKKVHHGLLRVGGYMHVRPNIELPSWYLQTQGEDQISKFKDRGSPRTFVFNSLTNLRQELVEYKWDLNRPNHPVKTKDHLCDAVRYALVTRPEAGRLPTEDKFKELRLVDPGAAREWEAFDRRVQARKDLKNGRLSCVEENADYIGEHQSPQPGKPRNVIEWEG
jgi:Phage terminase large subunit